MSISTRRSGVFTGTLYPMLLRFEAAGLKSHLLFLNIAFATHIQKGHALQSASVAKQVMRRNK
jgi:hypothetical protein